MDKDCVKRNYNFIIYTLLKNETSKYGTHLTAPEICKKIAEDYGIKEPNKKTIYQFEKDFKAFGFDVCHDKDGYYLGERCLSLQDLNIIATSVEQTDMPSEMKDDIYEKLTKITGIQQEEFESVFYEQEKDWNLHYFQLRTYSERVQTVFEALEKKKQIKIFSLCSPKLFFLFDYPKEVDEYFNDILHSQLIKVNPYKIFKNKSNEICLLFYVTIKGNFCVGACGLDVSAIEEVSIIDKDIEPCGDIQNIIYGIDFLQFTTARGFREGDD